jgi:O-antigen ligase
MTRRISQGIGLVGAIGSLAMFTSLFDPFAAAKSFAIALGNAGQFGYGVMEILKNKNTILIDTKKYFIFAVVTFIGLFLARTVTTSDINGALFGVVGRHSGFITYFSYVLLFVISVSFVRIANLYLILRYLLIAGLIAGCYSLLETIGAEPWKMSKVYEGTSGLFGNPNFSGAFLSLTVILSFWILIAKERNVDTVLAVLAFPLGLFGVYTSKALQGVISIAIGIAIIVLVKLFTKARSFGFLGLAGAGVAGLFGILGSLQIGPLSSLLYKTSVSERGDMWRTAIAMIKDQPIWGVGIERYGVYFRQYRDLKQALRAGPDVFSDNAHNVVLHLMATGGIVLGLLYLAVNCAIFFVAIRGLVFSAAAQRKSITIALALWLPIQAQNSISVDNPGVFVWSWILGGAIVALVCEKEDAQNEIRAEKRKMAKAPIANAHPLSPVIALLCILIALGVTVKPLIAQKSFAFAFFLGIDPKIPETLTNKEAALIKAEKQDSGNITWPRYSANSLFIDKAWKETISAANRAVSKDPEDWVSWWFMASAYEESGDRVAAIPARLKTVELDPLNTSVLLELAKNYRASGDEINFEKTKSAILRINPASPDAQAVSGL